MNIIFESIFGSHLYGLETPNSDKDYKGIILPTAREILLGKSDYHIDSSSNLSNSKNTENDIDRSYYTLSYFIKLACKGETVALDLLSSNPNNLIHDSEIWQFLITNKSRFYTKSMKSYIGYVKKQAAKYGIKGSRLGELERAIEVLSNYSTTDVIGDVDIEESDVVRWIDYKGNRYLEICGSKFQDNLRIPYALGTMEKIVSKYGERSKLAKENLGVDWKAVSHCLRAGYQAKDIYTKGYFEYPLDQTDYLLKVKTGKLDFATEVEPEIDKITKEVMRLSNASNFPEEVDYTFWDDFVCQVYRDIVVSG